MKHSRPWSWSADRLLARLGVLLLLAAAACGDAVPTDVEGPAPYSYASPADIGDGLGGAEASTVGLDQAGLQRMVREIELGLWPNIHSVLVFRSGELVLEEYFEGTMRSDSTFREFGRDSLHDAYSVSKSFTSAAVGLAIASGDITSVDQPVADFFPEYVYLGGALASGDLDVHHLLNMTAGLEWDESSVSYTDPANSHTQMKNAADPIEFVFSRDQVEAPGIDFVYSTGLSSILGEIVARATGTGFEDYLDQELLEPLGITEHAWLTPYYNDGLAFAGGGLQLRPRDMLKFGVLYMNGGVWQGQQIVPSAWVSSSTEQQGPEGSLYGYQWWLGSLVRDEDTTPMFRAAGLGGQHIFVFPGVDLVVVFTGNGSGSGPYELTSLYVLAGIS
jgi:CubicO group peptidase (beta-lactamase class C family)